MTDDEDGHYQNNHTNHRYLSAIVSGNSIEGQLRSEKDLFKSTDFSIGERIPSNSSDHKEIEEDEN